MSFMGAMRIFDGVMGPVIYLVGPLVGMLVLFG